MSEHIADDNARPDPDPELVAIADYVVDYEIDDEEVYDTARNCLIDTLGCGFLALQFPACVKLLGPIVPGAEVEGGARVPGTRFQLDPVKAAFDIGAMVRWLDFNDTWLAAEWGHPSDNLGAILAVSDYLSRQNVANGKAPLTIRDVLTAMIKAHEIQGILALENSFNRVGLDHVVLVKVASTAVAAGMLGLAREQIVDAVSQAWVDGQSLRTYRHAPNTGSRKSWAAGDASSRGVRLAMITALGEMGIPSVLSAEGWGFYDTLFKGKKFTSPRTYQHWVMQNILFKISFPAEFHAQTAAECAIALHSQTTNRLDEIDRIEIGTQEAALRIISKDGPLHNPADRDHCLQYMIAVPLIHGYLTAECYENDFAADPRIDRLREKMRVHEEPRFTEEYYDLDKRAIGNSVRVFFKDGASTEKISVDYPIGHRRRRAEGIPLLEEKFLGALRTRFPEETVQTVYGLCLDQQKFESTPVNEFLDMLTI